MLRASRERIDALLDDDALVLDVGGGASPLARADWVLDLLPYAERGSYGYDPATADAERFSAERWVSVDICGPDPWPFADRQFDFAVCSHTLEDVRDPVWVCRELCRVARAGYIEVPSRLEEQSYGFQGPWIGWNHHRWLVDVDAAGKRIEFAYKNPILGLRRADRFPPGFHATLSAEERVQQLWWEGGFEYGERVFLGAAEYDAYVRAPLAARKDRPIPAGARATAARRLLAWRWRARRRPLARLRSR